MEECLVEAQDVGGSIPPVATLYYMLMAVKKKKRESKRSMGTARGSKKVPLTEVQKVLLGKGMYARWKSLPSK